MLCPKYHELVEKCYTWNKNGGTCKGCSQRLFGTMMDKLTNMIMDLDKDGLHAGIIMLTVEDYDKLCEELKPEMISDIKDARITSFRKIPIALTTKSNSNIITQEDIDIIESYKRSNKANVS